jgi:hypothetical protein
MLTDLSQISFDKQEIYFNIPNDTLLAGVSYKVQIAYIDNTNIIGYFSTVGIVKYTAKPQVVIEGLEDSQLHSDTHVYIGNYS